MWRNRCYGTGCFQPMVAWYVGLAGYSVLALGDLFAGRKSTGQHGERSQNISSGKKNTTDRLLAGSKDAFSLDTCQRSGHAEAER